MRTPFVIAEFASSHDGDLDRLLRGVATAKECDADAFKTWWTSDAKKTCERMHAPEMLDTNRVGQFPQGWLPIIASACKANGLEFLCTVDLPEDIGVVAPFVDRLKVASWGANDEDFIEAHCKYGKPILISTGGLDDETLTNQSCWYLTDETVSLLHCVSGYPVPIEDANLGVIRAYNLSGFSDHTKRILMGALAVAAGARIPEVHFCLPDTSKDNADRCVSHEPEALKEYIALARKAAIALGDGVKRIMPSEEKFLRHRYLIP